MCVRGKQSHLAGKVTLPPQLEPMAKGNRCSLERPWVSRDLAEARTAVFGVRPFRPSGKSTIGFRHGPKAGLQTLFDQRWSDRGCLATWRKLRPQCLESGLLGRPGRVRSGFGTARRPDSKLFSMNVGATAGVSRLGGSSNRSVWSPAFQAVREECDRVSERPEGRTPNSFRCSLERPWVSRDLAEARTAVFGVRPFRPSGKSTIGFRHGLKAGLQTLSPSGGSRS